MLFCLAEASDEFQVKKFQMTTGIIVVLSRVDEGISSKSIVLRKSGGCKPFLL
jgi:hypothetical protein